MVAMSEGASVMPLSRGVARAGPGARPQLRFGVSSLLGRIEQDRSRFEEAERRAAAPMGTDDGRTPAALRLVGKPGHLDQDRHLDAAADRPGIARSRSAGPARAWRSESWRQLP